MHIFVAMQPRSYRMILSTALQILRPQITTTLISPEYADHEVIRVKPQLTLCSRLTTAIDTHCLAWIVLYPAGKNIVHIRSDKLRLTTSNFDLNQLLVLIDSIERSSFQGQHSKAVNE